MSKKAKLFLLLITAGAAAYNIFLPLHPDEAYYWVWSRNLQLSYFDHPPLIAYFIRIITFLGQQEAIIRLVAILSVSLTSYIIYLLARDMFNKDVAEKSLIIFLLMPLAQAGYLVVSPDSPLILFWALTIYLFYRYIYRDDSKCIYLAGISAGLLILSKYTGVLLLAGLFIFLLITKKRYLLLKKEVLIGIIIIFMLFTPVLVWNYNHDWVSFKFQFTHGVSQDKNLSISYLGEFIAGQLIAFNPVFFLLLFYLIVKNIKNIISNKFLFYLLIPFLFTFMFFLYQGLYQSSEVNWPAPAYISAVIILAYYIDKLRLKQIYTAGIVMAVILLILVRFPLVIPGLPEEAVLLNKFSGYDKIFKRAGDYIHRDELILSDSYQNASLAQYYLPGRPEVFIITPSRVSNYNYWSKEIKEQIEKGSIEEAVFIGRIKAVDELESYFKDVKKETVLRYNGRYIDREYYLYKCDN